MGKAPELVCETEKFQLVIFNLTSIHSKASGASFPRKGWTLFQSGVANGKRRWARVAILIVPKLSACTLAFTPVDERVASLHPQVGGQILTIVYAYSPNSCSAYPFLESLEGVLEIGRLGWSLVFADDVVLLDS